jgi:hypothetical protein
VLDLALTHRAHKPLSSVENAHGCAIDDTAPEIAIDLNDNPLLIGFKRQKDEFAPSMHPALSPFTLIYNLSVFDELSISCRCTLIIRSALVLYSFWIMYFAKRILYYFSVKRMAQNCS